MCLDALRYHKGDILVRLLLIRHAATDVSEKKILLGSTDREASASGLDQLKRLPVIMEPYAPSEWYCSPLQRAVQTAERLGELQPGLDYVKEERLREIHFGRWEMKSFAEIEASEPDLIPVWSAYHGFVFPEGEAVDDFVARVRSVVDELRTTEDKEIGIITHGGVIRTMICLALGFDPRNYLLFSIAPASLTILDLYSEGGILAGLNL